jgi:glycosyltransferase involved in cell wall biosynthesis
MNNISSSAMVTCYYGVDPISFSLMIKSLEIQSYQPDEYVFVIDGPICNRLQAIIHKFKEFLLSKSITFKCIELPDNCGVAKARSEGLKYCNHDYIILVDSDDINHENRFKIQFDFINENPDIDVLGSHVECIFDYKFDNFRQIKKVPLEHNDIKKYLKYRSPFNNMTVVLKKLSVEFVGGYHNIYNNEDYDLWIRMSLNGCIFYNLDKILVYSLINSDTYSRRGGWKYFKSELSVQKLLYSSKINNFPIYIFNLIVRFIVQILMPCFLRRKFYDIFLRKNLI